MTTPLNSSPNELGSSISDRRRAERQASRDRVRVIIETTQIDGETDNLSRTGILFFTDSELRVRIEIEEGGQLRELDGQLVRCDRIQGDRRGWAVEFDQP